MERTSCGTKVSAPPVDEQYDIRLYNPDDDDDDDNECFRLTIQHDGTPFLIVPHALSTRRVRESARLVERTHVLARKVLLVLSETDKMSWTVEHLGSCEGIEGAEAARGLLNILHNYPPDEQVWGAYRRMLRREFLDDLSAPPTVTTLKAMASDAVDAQIQKDQNAFESNALTTARRLYTNCLKKAYRAQLTAYRFQPHIAQNIAESLVGDYEENELEENGLFFREESRPFSRLWFATARGECSGLRIADNVWMTVDDGRDRCTLGPQGRKAWRLKGYTSLVHILRCAASGLAEPPVSAHLFLQPTRSTKRSAAGTQPTRSTRQRR